MSTSFPTSVWNGTARGGRSSGLHKRAPNKFDWARMVEEIRAMQRVCDGIGLTTAGAFPESDPSKTNQWYPDDAYAQDEVQSLAAISSVSGTWTITITLPGNDPVTTAAIAYDADTTAIDSAIDTALAGLSVYGTAYVNNHITVGGGPINAAPVTLTFGGASVTHLDIPQVTTASVDLSDDTPPVVSTTTAGLPDGQLTLSGAGTPDYPNVWDRTTPKRDASDAREPVWEDWQTLVDQIAALEARVLTLGINADGTIPTEDPLQTGAIFQQSLAVAVSAGGGTPVEVWDGLSRTREVYPAAKYAPDGWDWFKAYQRVYAMQRMLVPLGFDADGAIPTSDPAVAGELWMNANGIVEVSAGV